ncbi:MAG: DUF2797 domain-containing protein [Candidatus Thorarchaeota archaeon]
MLILGNSVDAREMRVRRVQVTVRGGHIDEMRNEGTMVVTRWRPIAIDMLLAPPLLMEQYVASDHMAASVVLPDERYVDETPAIACVVTGHEYRWFFGTALPYLTFVDTIGHGAIQLLGDHIIRLENRLRCTECMQEVKESSTLCPSCRERPVHKRLRCVLDGPGVPFGEPCTLETPPCEEHSWAKHFCYKPWIVYIAVVFGAIKVGISRQARGGSLVGFTQRLLSQGACQWIAIGPMASLPEALRVEDQISNELGLTQRVTSQERWRNLSSGICQVELPRTEIAEWLKQNEMDVFMHGDFTNEYLWPSGDAEIDLGSAERNIEGRIVMNVGPMVGFARDDVVIVFDLTRLVGHAIVGDM